MSNSVLFVTTGPESCGKTTLAQALAAELKAPLVLEAARDYLNELCTHRPEQPYRQSDLLEIAQLQLQRETDALGLEPPQLVCDTDLLVILVWSEVRYGGCQPALQQLFEKSRQLAPRHYLLCDHQIPWEPDPLREHPQQRDRLFGHYLHKLQLLDLPYTLVSGTPEQRLGQALAQTSRLRP